MFDEELRSLEPLMSDRPTRFELLTAAALAWFADEAVDAGVIEVGVGGTWDATNVVDGTVSVVTNISYDHTEILGPTLEGITSYLSIIDHFDDFGKGIIDTTHLVYYVSFITFGLFPTAKSVDSERWRG